MKASHERDKCKFLSDSSLGNLKSIVVANNSKADGA